MKELRILLTGANGFVAPYLSRELSQHGHQVFQTGREAVSSSSSNYFCADLTDRNQTMAAVAWAKPDAVVHLAGISNVAAAHGADRAPFITAVNVTATQYLCDALAQQAQPSTLLFVSTGLIYQPSEDPGFKGFRENSPLGPLNDYGWSKLAAESITRIYNSQHVNVYVVRPFNHIGPGQDSRFVAPALAQRIIDAGDKSVIPVGDLSAQRDFTDVRDIVRAYRLILERRPEEKTFVLGSGRARPIQEILDFFVEYSGKRISCKSSDELLRAEHNLVFGDASLARRVLGWQPEIPFQQTLKEIYDHLMQSKNI